jgi:hypothetical protein
MDPIPEAPYSKEPAPQFSTVKPDWGMFVGIIGLLAAFVIPILQANGVTMNWLESLLAYVVIIGICIWSFLKYAVPHKSRKVQFIGAIFLSVLIGSLAIYAVSKQYALDRSPSHRFDEVGLLARYPLGYEIFYLDYSQQIIPYKSAKVLNDFIIDWTAVRYVEIKPDYIRIRLPGVMSKTGTGPVNALVWVTGGPKRVGRLPGFGLGQKLVMSAEILDVRQDGIVFVVGFSSPE